MQTGPDAPLTFHRSAQSKWVGCLAYLLMVPAVAAVALILGGLLGAGLAHLLRWKEDLAILLGASLGGFCSIGAVVWGIRDYRRRSGHRFEVKDDRLDKVRGDAAEAYRFDDLDWIEGPSLTTLTLRWTDGRRIRLRVEEWPVKEIGDALALRAVPVMVRKLTERIARGDVVEFKPAGALVLRSLVTAVIGFGLAGLLIYGWSTMPKGRSGRAFGLPILLLGAGVTAVVHLSRARGGILIESAGLRSRKQDPVIPWDDLWLDVRTDGLRLERGDGGKPFVLGALVRNYPVCVAFLSTRVRGAPPPGEFR